MENEKKSKNEIVSWDTHLDKKYGERGTSSRTDFEVKAHTFIVGEVLKEERVKAHLTQAQLAEKTGTKKSYISRIENGKGNVQLSTLIRLFELGLNKRIGLTFL